MSTATTATERLLSLEEYQTAKRIGIYLSMPKGELCTGRIVRDAFQRGKKVFVPYIYKSSRDSATPRSLMGMVGLDSLKDYEALKPDAWGIPSVPKRSIDERQCVVGSRLENERRLFKEDSVDIESSYDNSTFEPECLDIIVMPGVTFDSNLRRLGHGKGFYDDFLKRYKSSQARSMPSLGKQKLRVRLSQPASIVSDFIKVGLSLDVQFLPEDQIVPTDSSDWDLDVVIVGNGKIVRRRWAD